MTSLLATLALFADAAPAAPAAGEQAQGGSGNLMIFAVYALFIGGFYFLAIRPQQKRAKETAAKQAGLKTGDRVATTGGIVGKVVSIDSETNVVTLQVSEGVRIPFLRQHVTEFLSEETKA